jgi:geranylgeranyl reductase family protein
MDRCDVLVVGGGPAGSSCARRLVRAGLDVVVLDKARFPRDKVCAGWITPAVVRALELDLDEYGRHHTLQPFTGFRTGPFGSETRLIDFGTPISYGIRRCEFDHYLLRRSGARVMAGQPLTDLRRATDGWIANGTVQAAVVVGAGGHFCPVARQLNPRATAEDVVVAQEVEFRLDDETALGREVDGESPELFFWSDLLGYGWCVQKGRYLNIGAGRLSRSEFPAAVRQFTAMLEERGLDVSHVRASWKGHAYLLGVTSTRTVVDDRVLLAGDAAGLALAPSGEGILAAVESGVMAAETILSAAPDYSRDRLAAYSTDIEARFGRRGQRNGLTRVPAWVRAIAARIILGSSWLSRRVLIEDAFLHTRRKEFMSDWQPPANHPSPSG